MLIYQKKQSKHYLSVEVINLVTNAHQTEGVGAEHSQLEVFMPLQVFKFFRKKGDVMHLVDALRDSTVFASCLYFCVIGILTSVAL